MSSELKKLPQVSRWRSLARAAQFLENPIPVLQEYQEELGDTYTFHAGGVSKGVLSTNPDFIQHILQKNNKNYPKSYVQKDLLGAYIGWGLLTIEGDFWLRQRRLIQPGFHREKLKGLLNIMQDVTENATDHFETKAKHNETVDIFDEMMDLAFKMVAKSLFSASIAQEKLEILEETITSVQAFIIKQIRQPFLHPWFLLSGKIKKHKAIAQQSHQIMSEIIEERKKSDAEFDDLLDMLLNVRYEDTGEAMDIKQLIDESLIIFVAGHETTANALAWTFYLLAQYPEAVAKLRQEFDTVLGTEKPTFENLRNLTYTTQVINESMRLYPPAWLTDRVAAEDDVINGYPIQKGTLVLAYIYGAHHSSKNWDKPEEFRPERFAKELKKERHNFSYLPFGGGPRLCIGNNFAIMEMQLVIVHLIRQYDFEIVDKSSVELHPLITLRPRNGIKMKLKKRE